MDHQHLTVTVDPCADADGGDGQSFGDLRGQLSRDALQHQGKGPGLFHCQGILHDLSFLFLRLALHLISPHLVDGLGGQADVPHDGDVDGGDGLDDPLHVHAPLQFYRLGAALLDHPAGIALGVLDADLIGHEGHIDDHQGPRYPFDHGPGMVDHLLDGDGEGIGIPGHHRTHRIPHEEDVHPGLIQDPGEWGIIGGEHGDLFTPSLHRFYARYRYLLGHFTLLALRLAH